MASPTTTVMIYLAGDNNLSAECIYALTELKRANPTLIRIFAQYDPSDEFLPTQRYRISHSDHGPLAEDLIDQFPFQHESPNHLPIRKPRGERRERRGEGGTGDPKMLYNFVAFCVDSPRTKTDHYVLIVCGHGAGVQRDFLLRDNRPDGYLTINELRLSLRTMHEKLTGKDGRHLQLDIFGMDVCLMSMAEITNELNGLVKIAIGCESYSPAAGWPYRQTVERIQFHAERTQAALVINTWNDISKEIVKQYVRFYSDYWLGGLSITMSALWVGKIDGLKLRLRNLANEMIYELEKESHQKAYELYQSSDEDSHADEQQVGADNRLGEDWHGDPQFSFSDALILAHWRAQSYNGELYVDLADFCDCLAKYVPREISALCREVSRYIKEELTIISCSWGREYQYSNGISIYFPWDSLVPYYGASIAFPTATNWLPFLNLYVEVTRREPRGLGHSRNMEELQSKLNAVRMASDKMASDKMASDKGGNPMHSMRNPPIVFIPDGCLDDKDPIDKKIKAENTRVQKLLMRGVELKDLLLDPKIRAQEENTPAELLLTRGESALPEDVTPDDQS